MSWSRWLARDVAGERCLLCRLMSKCQWSTADSLRTARFILDRKFDSVFGTQHSSSRSAIPYPASMGLSAGADTRWPGR